MMMYAKMNNVDMLLIAGDTFDGEYVTRETLSLLRKEFETFGKPVFITPGNHDCASRGSVWLKNIFPDNVHVFTEETLTSFELPEIGAAVYGFAFTSPSMDYVPFRSKYPDNPDLINILLCHCDMITPRASNTTCPVTEDDLETFGADYAALGHIHNPPEPGPASRWSYCGCLEPRGFDELGPKGACMVEIDKKDGTSEVRLTRVRFSKKRYEKGEIVLSGIESAADAGIRIREYIAERKLGDDTLLSLKLSGPVPPSVVLLPEVLEEYSSPLYHLRIEDLTHPDVDAEALENDIGIRGEVYRYLKPKLLSQDPREKEVAERALRYAFSALDGDSAF